MKIFFTANVLWDIYIFRGGVIKALVEDGHDVTVVAPYETRVDMEKELGVKVVNINLNKRGMNPIEDIKLFFELYKISLPLAEEVCVLNEDDKNLLVSENIIKKEKVFILPGEGINTEKFLPMEKTENLKDEKIIFLMIARAFFDKGVKEYVEAAENIKNKYPDTEFFLCFRQTNCCLTEDCWRFLK